MKIVPKILLNKYNYSNGEVIKLKEENNITEQRNPNTKDIDKVSTIEMMTLLNEEDKLVAEAVALEIPDIAKSVDVISETLRKGGRLIYMGAGTSGRIGVLDASEVTSAYGIEDGRILAFIAGGTEALTKSIGGAQDDKAMGVEELKSIGFSCNDVIVGISSSGSTPYVTGALEYAKRLGGPTIALTCTRESECAQIADILISTVVGPEAITGSTRLKSASAHKMVLNMISTGVMIRLGKVYENLMIEVQPANYKLMRRRNKVVCEACHVDGAKADELLSQANGNTRIAIIMGLTDLTLEQARVLLEYHGNDVRAALTDEVFQQNIRKMTSKPPFE